MKIMLDAGHYGKKRNKGASNGYYESAVMWDYHLLLKKELEKYKDITVFTTRDDLEKDLPVFDRGLKAKGCDLFISCHSNAYKYISQAKADRVTRSTGIYSINEKFAKEGERVAGAIASAIANLHKEFDPKTYGRIYQKPYSKKLPKVDYYGVIRGAVSVGCNAVIIEHSFHTSRFYCGWAMSPGNLRRMAEAEAKAIADVYDLKLKEAARPMYRIQLGAFRDRENAEAALLKIRQEYPDAFIRTSFE